MKLKAKTSLLTITFVVAMLMLLTMVSSYAFRHFSLTTAKEHARSAAEVVRVGLTESMINGVIDKRESFLKRLADVEGLKEARVVRGPNIRRQFGEGLGGAVDTIQADAIETRVMETGIAYYHLVEDSYLFRATIPYVASDKGTPNCLQCHQVSSGSVLGVITLTIDIHELKEQAVWVLSLMIGTFGVSALLFLLLFRRQLNPVIETAQGVQEVVSRARLGEFSGRINYQGNDEMAQIAGDLNRLMSYLEERLGETCQVVASLMKYELPDDIDLLQATTDMVSGLVDVSQFKQEIEGDQTKQEVYNRISYVLQDQFKLGNFSIYECNASRNLIIPMVVDGNPEGQCHWCDPAILEQADACRALRMGQIIDSVAQPRICSRFRNNGKENFQHICMPMIHTGSVGSVVQLVFNGEFSQEIYRVLPLILVYLRESSTVVEAKRLMSALRETTLRDAMTGLRNRRFLEEYMNTLVASTQRKQQRLSVLMMDLDKFKSVNDTYGHEAGDMVLKSLAKTLESQVRESDLVIRYGGEEFMVILQETQDTEYCGDSMAEKLRASIEAMNIQIPGHVLQKTISIGVSHFPEDHADFWQTVKYADAALFRAKESGRNRVVRWDPKIDLSV